MSSESTAIDLTITRIDGDMLAKVLKQNKSNNASKVIQNSETQFGATL